MFINALARDPSLESFRQEVRDFCATQIGPELRRKLDLGQHLTKEDYNGWLQALGEKGWLGGNWPKEAGGQGWSAEEAAIFREETGRAGAPWLIPVGVTMVGPVIYTFGTPEQKAQHLPGILKNTTWWCQGYSEPGSGSDLASLRTRAVKGVDDDGAHYRVTGQKIWTTLAHWADWCFCLVRTDPEAKPQKGISFLLIDMKSPGITVRPIITLDMGHHVNEVFFDDVRVPAENLIGEENKGWDYAKFLLANERVGVAELGSMVRYLDQLKGVLAKTMEGGKPLSESPEFQRRVAELEVQFATLEALVADQHAAHQSAADQPSLIGAAALKIRGSELQQAILQCMTDALARHGLAYQADALVAGWNGELMGPAEMAGILAEHLHRRAATIYGGSSEIQRNIIAKGALGL